MAENLKQTENRIRLLSLEIAVLRYDIADRIINKYEVFELGKMCEELGRKLIAHDFWKKGREKELEDWSEFF